MSQAEAALETALTSSGSAARENERYIDSINGKLATLDSAIQTFSHNILSSDLYKFVIDIGIAAVETANTLGSLATTVGVATVAFLALAKKNVIVAVISGLGKLTGATKLTSIALDALTSKIALTKAAALGIAGVLAVLGVSLISTGWDKLSTWIDDLNVTLEEHLDLIKDTQTAYDEQADKVKKLSQTVKELKDTLNGVNNGTLELADGQTVSGLERELELQSMLLAIEQQREKTKRNELDSELVNTLAGGGRGTKETGFDLNAYMTTGATGGGLVETQISMHEQLQQEIDKSYNLYEKYQAAVKKANSANATEQDYANVQKAKEEYLSMRSEVESTLYTITDVTSKISTSSDKYQEYNSKLDESTEKYNKFKVSVGEVNASLKNNGNILNTIISDNIDLAGVIEELEDSTSLLSQAQDEMNESGGLQLDTIKELIDAGKTELLYLDEETGAIKLNTAVLKTQTLARIADEIAAIDEAITTNEATIKSLEAEAKARGRTTEIINQQAEALAALNSLRHKRDIFTGLQTHIETGAYIKDTKSNSSSSKDKNKVLEDYKKQLAHAKALNKYHLKEEEYIQKLVYAYTKLCKTSEERQELEEMIYEAQQAYNERLADDYSKQQDALEKMIDYSIKIIKKQKEEEIDAIEEATEAYEKQYNARKKALQDLQDDENYAKELAKKQKAVTDIEAKLTALQYDDSVEATKRRLELEEELAKAREELEEHQRERYFDEQEDALDEEMDRFEEAQEEKVDVIEDYLDDEQKVRKDALSAMEQDYDAFYTKLEEYCNQYEGYVSEEIKDAWADAKTALDAFNSSQMNVAGTLEDLIAKQKELNKVLEAEYYTSDPYKDTDVKPVTPTQEGVYYASNTVKDKYAKNVATVLSRLSMAESMSDFKHAKDDIKAYIDSISYILKQPAIESLPDSSDIKSDYKELLEKLQDAYKAAYRGYLSGGVVDQYGMAMLHGDKRHSEVVFSSEDAKKLWSLIHNIPEFQTDRPSNVGTNTNQEISIGEVMSVTIESGAVVTDEVLDELRNIATQVKKDFVDSLSKTGYRPNLASRRL